MEHEKINFIKILNKNPDLLNYFSIEQLEVILDYYKELNDKKRRKIGI